MFYNLFRPRYRDFCNRGIYDSCRREFDICYFCGKQGCDGRCRHERGCRCDHRGCGCRCHERCRDGDQMNKAFIEGCVGGYLVKFDMCKK